MEPETGLVYRVKFSLVLDDGYVIEKDTELIFETKIPGDIRPIYQFRHKNSPRVRIDLFMPELGLLGIVESVSK